MINENNQNFIDCENIKDNFATFDFNTKVLKQRQTQIDVEQVKRISLILSTDLINFVETDGNNKSLTANEVYTHLLNNQ